MLGKKKSPFSFNINSSPVLAMSPHSGTNYSKHFMQQTSLSLSELRESEDCHVNKIIDVKSKKYSTLIANFPRIFVDVNRSPLDIDPDMWEQNNLKKIFFKDSSKVREGIGIFHRVSLNGNGIYSQKLNIIEAKYRLFNYYFPYHKKIKEILKKKKNVYKELFIFDVHSMSSKIVSNDVDIILSNGDGKTSNCKIIEKVKKVFERNNYKVFLNNPFKGGFICHYYGEPKCNIHATQIEINKKNYMCEKSLKIKKEKMTKLKLCFSNIIQIFNKN